MSIDIHSCNGIKLAWRYAYQRCSFFSPQRKSSLQQEITLGHLSQTHRRELEAKLSEMEREIMRAKEEQEKYQKEIDKWKQLLQDTSQEQDKGRTRVLAPVMFKAICTADD